MEFSEISQYSVEGAASAFMMVMAWKLYKMRIASSSSCCDDHLQVRTVSRGDSSHDLQIEIPQTQTIERRAEDIV
jgi:hypothetical protein